MQKAWIILRNSSGGELDSILVECAEGQDIDTELSAALCTASHTWVISVGDTISVEEER